MSAVLNFIYLALLSPSLTPAVTMATETDSIQFTGRCLSYCDNGTMPDRSKVFMSPRRQPPLW